jgi:hypothetical protein
VLTIGQDDINYIDIGIVFEVVVGLIVVDILGFNPVLLGNLLGFGGIAAD